MLIYAHGKILGEKNPLKMFLTKIYSLFAKLPAMTNTIEDV